MKPDVPRVPDVFLDCVAYLYPSVEDAEKGQRAGGSGFLVSVPAPALEGFSFVYVVTNKHVLDDGSDVLRLNTKDGKTKIVPTDDRQWFHHPAGDDLTIFPLMNDLETFATKSIPRSWFLTKAIMEEANIGIGDDTFLVGRFINKEGKQRNEPTVRFGSIAQMPNEPIAYLPNRFPQESFLVEFHAIGGYSGSPVFVYLPAHAFRPGRVPGTLLDVQNWRHWLLGIEGAFIPEWIPVHDALGNPTEQKVPFHTGMTAVIPAWKLDELLDAWELPRLREIIVEGLRAFGRLPPTRDSELPAAMPLRVARPPAPTPEQPAESAKAEHGPEGDADWHDPAEAARRRDATLRRMLGTPPRPGKSGKPPAP